MNIDAIAAVGVFGLVTLCIIAAVVNDVRTTRLIQLTTLGFGKVALDIDARERRVNRAVNNLNKDTQEALTDMRLVESRVTSLEDARLYDIFAQRLADGTFREEHVTPRRTRATPVTKVSTRVKRGRR